MTPLNALLHRWAAAPFVWGQLDCALGIADWYLYLHDLDPAAHLRGQYHDARSCQRLCGWFSDPVAVIEGCLATVGGLPRVEDGATLRPGDVAVIDAPVEGRRSPVGAIWLGEAWGIKGQREDCGGRGATTLHPHVAPVLAAWGMGYVA
jgi:hypothetical protein